MGITVTLRTIMEKTGEDLIDCLPSVPGPSAKSRPLTSVLYDTLC